MNSIRFRMIVLFTVVTTLTLAAFGIYARSQLADSLDAQFERLARATMSRLEINTTKALWDLDKPTLLATMDAEMLQPEVQSIQIFDFGNRLFCGLIRDAQGGTVPLTSEGPQEGYRLDTELFRHANGDIGTKANARSNLIGTVSVHFSRKHIDEALRADARRNLIEILVVDLCLVVALSLSLGMVFKPLQRLRDALFELAAQEGDEVQALSTAGRTEFAEVVQGFNQTLLRLQNVMQRHTDAEHEALAAAKRAEQATLELQAAQESLLQAEKMASLGGLVAGVAHEINTPVGITLTSASGLMSATDKLQASLVDGTIRKSAMAAYVETAQSFCTLILRNSERAAHLIQSFKQVAVDQTSEQRRAYDLQKYIDEVISSLHPVLSRNHVQVVVACPQAILLDGYPGAMAQVLTNLAMNAVNHAFKGESGARIEITAQCQQERVSILFEDNGCGIASENVAKIFDPFFTTRRGEGGTGLGLNIVYNIMAKQFGGSIVVDSVVGRGTRFILKFPRTSPVAMPESKK